MAKKKVKLRISRVLVLIALIIGIYFIYFHVIGDEIKVIYVKNNTLLSDYEIIQLSGIDTYPSFLKTKARTIEKKLKNNVFIENVVVTKKWGRIIELNVSEHKILFRDMDNNYILSDGHSYQLDKEYQSALLLNYIPDNVYKDFINAVVTIEDKVWEKVAEIKYAPNDYDDDLFVLYMNDKNRVQITVDKFENLNKYSEIIAELNGKHGILYLDSGNYFKIIE